MRRPRSECGDIYDTLAETIVTINKLVSTQLVLYLHCIRASYVIYYKKKEGLHMKKEYNKLVRDFIPDIIQSSGKACKTHTLSHPEYIAALRQKLDEEVAEYQESFDHEELADILEVVYALAEATGCSEDRLNALRQGKAENRGKFTRKILLETVE